ncbi:hypothetical protein OH807_35890 [Kitasatospora sp. NBC_01560]|uniref:hypothetical protein n=1 Tax=Kitasatospora sp. NBC_01560 TaxID=2975965 RepID=UPI00386F9989
MRTTLSRGARAAGLLLAAGLVGLTGGTAAHAADTGTATHGGGSGGGTGGAGDTGSATHGGGSGGGTGGAGDTGSATHGGRIPAGNFVLCSNGTYASYAVFPQRNMATVIVPPGSCVGLSLSGRSSETVVLYGYKPNGSTFKIATDTFDDRDGERIRTLNTPDNDDWTTF